MDDRSPTDEGILGPIGEPTVRQTRSIVRRGDGDDGPDLPPYGVCLLTPRSAVEGLCTGEKLGIHPTRAVANQVDTLHARERLRAEVAQVVDEVALALHQGVGGMCRAGHDRNRVAEPLLD